MAKAKKSKPGTMRKAPISTLRPMVGGIDIGSTEHGVCMPAGEDGEETALGAEYRRIARLKSAPVAVFAIARKLAQLVYRMLRFGQDYIDVGEEAYEQRSRTRRLAGLNAAAKSLGYTLVQEVPAVAAN